MEVVTLTLKYACHLAAVAMGAAAYEWRASNENKEGTAVYNAFLTAALYQGIVNALYLLAELAKWVIQ